MAAPGVWHYYKRAARGWALGEECRMLKPGKMLWALVLIPLLWGIYQTLLGVVALFTGG